MHAVQTYLRETERDYVSYYRTIIIVIMMVILIIYKYIPIIM